MDALPFGLEDHRDGVLREPVDLEVGMERAQLAGDRHVPPRMPEADRRGDKQRTPAAAACARPVPWRDPGRDELADQPVDAHWITGLRAVPGAV